MRGCGRFRIIVLLALGGSGDDGQVAYDSLQEEYPAGAAGHAYAALGKVFWETYRSSRDIGAACADAAGYADDNCRVVLAPTVTALTVIRIVPTRPRISARSQSAGQADSNLFPPLVLYQVVIARV